MYLLVGADVVCVCGASNKSFCGGGLLVMVMGLV